jgi:Protein of unknown function (DUF2851)
VTESFLHYIWQLQYFQKADLKTSSGEMLHVLSPGSRNSDAGPDFSGARIRIGDLEWRGSVEIHIRASGWNDHKHSSDEAYEKVILHVVWENDKPIFRTDGTPMPTLELKDRVDGVLWARYKDLYVSTDLIPCRNQWPSIPDIHKFATLDKTLMLRLEAKAKSVTELLTRSNNNWEQTCYQLLCKNFGFTLNAEPMLRLAQIVPHNMILKHINKPLQVEALLFGAAGFLEQAPDDEYTLLLKREYDLLRRKYSLEGRQMNQSQWKFLRLRPSNFPTVRLAQLAALLAIEQHLFSKILGATNCQCILELLEIEQSEYWRSHYRFGTPAKNSVPPLGSSSIQNIIINTVVPMLVAYGKIHDECSYVELATDLLHHLPAEDNKITRQWLLL